MLKEREKFFYLLVCISFLSWVTSLKQFCRYKAIIPSYSVASYNYNRRSFLPLLFSRLTSEDKKISIIDALSSIVDPDSATAITESGWISLQDIQINEYNDVEVVLNPSLVNEQDKELIDEIKKLSLLKISFLEWVNNVTVNVAVKKEVMMSSSKVIIEGMKGVKHIIAVSSCKGGVGKSTVSVNLAYTLKQMGHRVGILDADIYGPSLPTMTKPNITGGAASLYSNGKLIPPEFEGVKLMSIGFINQGASIMRGPMVNQILNQFVALTDWGNLDFLVIDMPPGTGDIQLTLAQLLDISAAVIVTTPQKLAFVDVVKGIDMFDTVNIPCVAENMADLAVYSFPGEFFDSLSEKVVASASSSVSEVRLLLEQAINGQLQSRRLFGIGYQQRLRDMWGFRPTQLMSLPLLPEMSASGDRGTPFVLTHPEADPSPTFRQLAEVVLQELDSLSSSSSAQKEEVQFDPAEDVITVSNGGRVSPFDLRVACRCAVCVEELTGRRLLDPQKVDTQVRPLQMAPIGRYAVSIDWSDGHKSLYPVKLIGISGSNKGSGGSNKSRDNSS